MVWNVALPHYLSRDCWSCGCDLFMQSQPKEGERERERGGCVGVWVCGCAHVCVRVCEVSSNCTQELNSENSSWHNLMDIGAYIGLTIIYFHCIVESMSSVDWTTQTLSINVDHSYHSNLIRTELTKETQLSDTKCHFLDEFDISVCCVACSLLHEAFADLLDCPSIESFHWQF